MHRRFHIISNQARITIKRLDTPLDVLSNVLSFMIRTNSQQISDDT